MQQLYQSNPSYNITDPILNTQTKFFVNNNGRLHKIIWYFEANDDGIREHAWGNEKKEKWDLQEANENDLIRAFKELALGNPKDFKTLYYTLKEHDDVTFSAIQETLQEIQETLILIKCHFCHHKRTLIFDKSSFSAYKDGGFWQLFY